jgi:hypothetical protein
VAQASEIPYHVNNVRAAISGTALPETLGQEIPMTFRILLILALGSIVSAYATSEEREKKQVARQEERAERQADREKRSAEIDAKLEERAKRLEARQAHLDSAKTKLAEHKAKREARKAERQARKDSLKTAK